MKKTFIFLFALLGLNYVTIGQVFNVISSGSQSLNINVSVPSDIQFKERLFKDGNNYSIFNIKGAGQIDELGKPNLPVFGKWILVPNGTKVNITVDKGNPVIYNDIDLAPIQYPKPDIAGEKEQPFVKDEVIYSTNKDYPGVYSEIEPVATKRGQSITILWVYPYQYNPVTKTLTAYPDLNIIVSFTGVIKPIPSNLINDDLIESLKGMAINAEAVLDAENMAKSTMPENKSSKVDGCEMLIITHSGFLLAANRLAAWKRRRGIITRVVTTTTTGGLATQIETYINNAYNTWSPAPSYVLFIGDANGVPTIYRNLHPYGGSQGHTAADIWYADVDESAGSTPVADMSYGRIPVATLAQADTVVNRIIRYEKTPPISSMFYTHTTNASYFQDDNNNYYADRRFAKTSEDVRTYLSSHGYIAQSIYSTNSTDPTYWNNGDLVFENDGAGGEELPSYLQMPTFSWDGSTSDISNAVNVGRFFIMHRDHGSRSGWSNPGFDESNVDALSNGEKRPIVFSINCETGWFDNETDDAECNTGYTDECFVESWINHSTGGSCGLIAPTRVSYSGNNDRLIWGWMDAVWSGFLNGYDGTSPINSPEYRMGDVLTYGLSYMMTHYTYGGDTRRTSLEEYNYFGDPTMEIWTAVPNSLTNAYNTTPVTLGTTSVTVKVEPAVSGMLVTVCTENSDDIFGTAYTNSSGYAYVTLNHAISVEPVVYVTITKHNYRPFEFMAGRNTWTGASSYFWNSAANWSNGIVPNSVTDVIIPAGTPYPCWVSTNDGFCRDITVETGSSLLIYDEVLTVSGNMHIYGLLKMEEWSGTPGKLYVAGDIVWESGSSATILSNTLNMFITGDWNFESGANVHLDQGYVTFEGTGHSYIRSYESNCYFNHIRSAKSSDYVGVSGLSDKTLNIHGNIYNYSGSSFNSYSSYPIELNGFFNNMGGNIHCGSGTFVFNGNPSAAGLKPNTGDYFNNLTINLSAGTLTLDNTYSNELYVNGDLVISGGSLTANDFDIYAAGNWTNTVGDAGFIEGTSRVIFNGGNYHQYCSTETFNELEVDKAFGGAFRVNGGNVTCAAYDWTAGAVDVLSGTFTVDDLLDNAITGAFYLNSGGTINLTNSGTGTYVDLKGDLHIFGGTMNVSGSMSWWPWNGDASIEMSGGVLDFKTCGITIYNSSTYTLTENITGGIIRTSKGFSGNRADFTPTAGTFEFYGSSDYSISQSNGCTLYNVNIDKSTKEGEPGGTGKPVVDERSGMIMGPGSKSNAISLSSDFVVTGDLTINSGVLNSNTHNLYIGGNWTDNAGSTGFNPTTATVIFNGSVKAGILTDETFYNLTLDKTYGSFDGLVLADGITVNVYSDLEISDGTMEMNSNSTLDVNGNVHIAAGAGLNAFGDTGLSIFVGGNWNNDNTGWNTNYGYSPGTEVLTFDGSADQTLTTNADREDFGNLVINMSGGEFRSNDSINVMLDFTLTQGKWHDNVNGLYHYFQGNFYVTSGAGAIWNSLTGNTVVFKGTGDQTVYNPFGSGYFQKVIVDKTGFAKKKSSSIEGSEIAEVEGNSKINSAGDLKGEKAMMVNLTSDLDIEGGGAALTIEEGILNLNGQTFHTMGDININNGGKLIVDDGARLMVDDGDALNVNSGGILEAIGSSGNNATISNRLTGFYDFSIFPGGTISANEATFEDMWVNGVLVLEGATIDPANAFTNCTFQNGSPGFAGLLGLNSDQTLTLTGLNFPSNTGGTDYNIWKLTDVGDFTINASTGVFTGPEFEYDNFNRIHWGDINIELDLTVMLEGPYNGTDMNTDLRDAGVLPLSQPFNVFPYWYAGAESVASIPANVVDWVLVELRDADSPANADAASTFEKHAAFLLNDGSIVDLDGSSPLAYTISYSKKLYPVILQLNHLAVISGTNLQRDASGVYAFDFTNGGAYGGAAGQKQVSAGVWAMFGGDGSGNGSINNPTDIDAWKFNAGEKGYFYGDYNLDSEVDNNDKNDICVPNIGQSSQVNESEKSSFGNNTRFIKN